MSIESGIIIANANINDFASENTSTDVGAGINLPGDLDLSMIIDTLFLPDTFLVPGITTFDATVIEFDFIPSLPGVEFEYVFASEEYCDFVNSQFNDRIGIFLSGPGINLSLIHI